MTAVPAEPIEDHTWRPMGDAGGRRTGTQGGPAIGLGMCGWLGTCNRPQDDHITTPDFRARRKAAR